MKRRYEVKARFIDDEADDFDLGWTRKFFFLYSAKWFWRHRENFRRQVIKADNWRWVILDLETGKEITP